MPKIKEFFARITEFFKRTEIKFMRSEYLIIILPILLVLLILLIYTPFLFNNNDLRFQVEQKVSDYTKGNLEIKGGVKVALLPTPSITINDAILQNYIIGNKNYNIYIKNTKIKISFLTSLIGKFSIKKITFSDAIIENYSANNLLELKSQELINATNSIAKNNSQDGINGNLFAIKKLDFNNFTIKDLPDIEIKNLKLISYSKLENKGEISNFNGSFEFSKKRITGSGNFFNQNIINNFKLDLKPLSKEPDSVLEIFSSYANFKIYGSFINSKASNQGNFGRYFKGIIEAEIFNLKDFYKSYVSDKGFVFNKINPATKSVKLKSGILKTNTEIVIDNIVISSNLMNGRGNVNIDLSSKIPLIDIKLLMENIDMDAIWLNDKKADAPEEAPEKAKEEKATQPQENIQQVGLNIAQDFRDFDLTLETKITRIRYLAEEIKNIDIYATISKNGEILILPLTLEAPGGGKFRISGAIEKRNNSPKFIGKIDAKGDNLANILRWLKIESQNLKYDNLKEYSIYSDLMLMPNTTVLNNFYLNINNQNTELLGEMKIDYSNKSSNIISNFEVHNLDIDDYFLTSGQNIYLSAGNLLKKVLWLNNITSKNDLTLAFDKLRYKNLTFSNQALKVRFGQGYLEIDQLKLQTDNFDLETSMAIDINTTVPKLDLSLKAKNFNYDSSNKAVLDIGEFQENIEQKTSQIVTKKLNAVDQFFAMPSLESFDGSVSIDFENANFDNFNVKNLKIDGKLRSGIIEFSQFLGEIYDGKFDFIGSTGIKLEKFLSGNLNLKSIRLKPFLKDLAAIENIDGIANISTSISSYGDKKESFSSNLNSELKINAGAVLIEGYGLNDLVKKMFNPFYFQKDLQNPLDILYNKSAKTNFKQASGIVTVNKGKENRFKIDFSGIASNGIISGDFNLIEKTINGTSNIIFLTGNKQKQVPVNIASNFKGNFDNILQNTNVDQAIQYIQAAQKQIDSGLQEPKFKQEAPTAAATAANQKPDTQNPPKTELSKEQLEMMKAAFPNGIPSLEEQLRSQNIEGQRAPQIQPNQ